MALIRLERAAVGRERLGVLAALCVPPAEVVQKRADPVRSRWGATGALEPALGPGDHVAGECCHVGGVAGNELLSGGECGLERLLEKRQRSGEIAGEPQDAPALEQDSRARDFARVSKRFRLRQETRSFIEPAVQPLDARELCQHLRAARTACFLIECGAQPEFACVEVCEVPQRAQAVVAHSDPEVEPTALGP